jgi:hypothetical protein
MPDAEMHLMCRAQADEVKVPHISTPQDIFLKLEIQLHSTTPPHLSTKITSAVRRWMEVNWRENSAPQNTQQVDFDDEHMHYSFEPFSKAHTPTSASSTSTSTLYNASSLNSICFSEISSLDDPQYLSISHTSPFCKAYAPTLAISTSISILHNASNLNSIYFVSLDDPRYSYVSHTSKVCRLSLRFFQQFPILDCCKVFLIWIGSGRYPVSVAIAPWLSGCLEHMYILGYPVHILARTMAWKALLRKVCQLVVIYARSWVGVLEWCRGPVLLESARNETLSFFPLSP